MVRSRDMNRRLSLSFLLTMIVAALFVTFGAPKTASAQGAWVHTGDAVRTKSVGPFTAKVYSIRHDMKEKVTKSKQAVIDADVDKRFSWKMLRSVDAEKIRNALREGYAKNGYSDGGKIDSFIASIAKELKEGDAVTISYDHAKKTTTITTPGGSATVPGEAFMKATWSLWFGNIDQPQLGDSLLNKF